VMKVNGASMIGNDAPDSDAPDSDVADIACLLNPSVHR
jgi:hypothetical protein